MAGKFEGLTDEQWAILEPLMPKDPKPLPRGKPHTPWRKVCNTIFWVLITGARWADVPKGSIWCSKSSAHSWLGIWQENGLLEKILTRLRELSSLAGLLDWNRLAADGFFSLR